MGSCILSGERYLQVLALAEEAVAAGTNAAAYLCEEAIGVSPVLILHESLLRCSALNSSAML